MEETVMQPRQNKTTAQDERQAERTNLLSSAH